MYQTFIFIYLKQACTKRIRKGIEPFSPLSWKISSANRKKATKNIVTPNKGKEIAI
jgi:hypothetical protein